MKNSLPDIGEIARISGLPVSTLRYYEEVGLIVSAGRKGLRRIYEASVIDRLAFINLAQMSGFTLEEIGQMAPPEKHIEIDREAVSAKADMIDRKIDELKLLSASLRHVAKCPEEDHFSCPKFRALLKSATRVRQTGTLA
ncbi:MAG: helix-turn-helix domain-containing protein [Rhizobiaceae bacterium]|jgi:DNA-binding transcriptional MerR regulator|nr:helix-turn-helix domain-containing protein [Rhizobiaceae bacterium]